LRRAVTRWVGAALLLGAAYASGDPFRLEAFAGWAYGPTAPAYFGLALEADAERGPFAAHVDGWVRASEALLAGGEAWLALRPLPGVEGRAGYAAWFAQPPALGRAFGVGLDWRVREGWSLRLAYDATGTWGVGTEVRWGAARLGAWARAAGWLAEAGWTADAFEARAWYLAPYSGWTPERYGFEATWRPAPYTLGWGYASDWGWTGRVGWEGPVELALEGRWNPAASLQGVASARWAWAPGLELYGELGRVWLPFEAWTGRLELRADAYAAPPSQGE